MLYLLLMLIVGVAIIVGLVIRKYQYLIISTATIVGVALTVGFSIMQVEPGEVGFTKTFGNLSYDTYDAGIHFVNPVATGLRENIRRRSLNYTGRNTADGLTQDRVALVVDVTIPYILNPTAAPVLHERYGISENWNLIGPASRNAIRDCTASLDWEEAVGEEGRATMATCIPARMSESVTADLVEAGLPEEVAETAFSFPSALVRRMSPENERILTAIAEEQAAIIDLRRQETLTSIAAEEANRRANEGSGIRQMMAELPEEYTVEEMVAMIEANAAKTNAEAFMKAVEIGTPNITVITGGGSDVPVTASAN